MNCAHSPSTPQHPPIPPCAAQSTPATNSLASMPAPLVDSFRRNAVPQIPREFDSFLYRKVVEFRAHRDNSQLGYRAPRIPVLVGPTKTLFLHKSPNYLHTLGGVVGQPTLGCRLTSYPDVHPPLLLTRIEGWRRTRFSWP